MKLRKRRASVDYCDGNGSSTSMKSINSQNGNNEKCKTFRRKLKSDPKRYELYKKKDAERKKYQYYQQKEMREHSVYQKLLYREKNRIKQQKRRARVKQEKQKIIEEQENAIDCSRSEIMYSGKKKVKRTMINGH